MATLDKAEQLEERLVMGAAQQGVSGSLRLTAESSKRLAQGTGSVMLGTGKLVWGVGADAQRAFSESLREMADGIRERAHEKKWGSEVPLEEFAETVDGKREVLELEDNELVEEVRQELRKHNVTFAVEQDDQERFYLHVRGNDANLIAHALDRAQERLDALRTRDEPTQEKDGLDRDEAQEQSHDTPDRDERRTASIEDELTAHEEAELNRRTTGPDGRERPRESLPEGYESVTDEGARQPAPTGREPREHERPAKGRNENHRQPERTEGRSRGDAPRRTGLDSREQSKATIRDKISAVADRLQSAAGRDAPTHVRGLDAHKKGPTR